MLTAGVLVWQRIDSWSATLLRGLTIGMLLLLAIEAPVLLAAVMTPV